MTVVNFRICLALGHPNISKSENKDMILYYFDKYRVISTLRELYFT